MTKAARLAGAAILAAGAALAIGCQNSVTGPSLTAVVGSLSLTPTLKVPAGENICCCHVVGTVRNTSSIAVNVQLDFQAKQGGTVVGTATVMVENVSPDAVRSFEAKGVYAPCSSLDLGQISADQRVRVIGLWEPR